MDVLFCGSNNQYAYKALKHIVDKGFNVKYILTGETISNGKLLELADEIHAETIKPSDAGDFYKEQFDVLISFTYEKILKTETIEAAKIAVNFHPAPLPYYKGKGTNMHAIINGESEWGITCHFLDAGIDTGSIIECRKFSVDRTSIITGKDLSDYTWSVGLSLMDDLLDRIIRKEEIVGHVQEDTGIYYSMRDLDALKKVNISESGERIARVVNALWYPPNKGAYIEKDGDRFYLMTEEIMKRVFDQMNS